MRLLPLIVLATLGCRTKDVTTETGDPFATIDADGDGYDAETDCDDADPAVSPGAEEAPYDGVDNDCDPATVDDDLDGDGLLAEEDCDDSDAGVTTGATFYADADGDGYGSELYAEEACEAPEGYVAEAGDCDDSDAAYNPGADESDCSDPNDYNCDGSVGYADGDGDGFPACEECDDGDAAVNPAATEVCDGLDNACDGEVDAGAVDASAWYADLDGDGYGDEAISETACDAPEGYVDNDDDCDDAEAAVNPGAAEVCNGLDDDCDGDVDTDASDASTWYGDGDGDGYGNAALSQQACDQPSGYVSNADDCDDGEPLAWTGAAETCDEVDNDCDSSVDEGVTTTWYADVDGDSYGSSSISQEACSAPNGYVSADGDCDEGDASINPGAAEVCDEVDNDCDGAVDDADSGVDTSTGSTFYGDSDGDGYGDAGASVMACEAPSGTVSDDTDCDDADAGINPGAAEICDTIDNDCDGAADGGVLGADAGCAAESCNEILLDGSSTGDGQYYLDPEGDGGAALYTCDMTTDGGGWTRITYWNREDDGDGAAELQAEMVEEVNNMGLWDESSSAYIRYNDLDQNSDVFSYYDEVEVPNGGETLLDLHYTGQSMECSAVWFYVEDASGNESDMYCRDDVFTTCSHWTAAGAYSSADLAYKPGYTCADSADDNWTWEEAGTFNTGAEVSVFNFRSMMFDANGDFAYIYRFDFYVR